MVNLDFFNSGIYIWNTYWGDFILKRIILIIALFLLAGCNSQPQKIDVTQKLVKCVVFIDHTECIFTDGTIMTANNNKINAVTQWDKSAWKNQS